MDVPRRLALFGLEHLPLRMANRFSIIGLQQQSLQAEWIPAPLRQKDPGEWCISILEVRFVNPLSGVTPHPYPTDETDQDCLAGGLCEPASESVALDLLTGKHTYSPTGRISAFMLQESISNHPAPSMILRRPPNTTSRSAERDLFLIVRFSEEASVQFQEAWLCRVPAQDVPSDRR